MRSNELNEGLYRSSNGVVGIRSFFVKIYLNIELNKYVTHILRHML